MNRRQRQTSELIDPKLIGWGLQILDGEKRIVEISYGNKFRCGNWPYSEKQSLQEQLLSGIWNLIASRRSSLKLN